MPKEVMASHSLAFQASFELAGVLADLPHVIERARERGFRGSDLQARSRLQPCDLFQGVPKAAAPT